MISSKTVVNIKDTSKDVNINPKYALLIADNTLYLI